MIRIIMLSAVLILSFHATGFTCSCVRPGPEIQEDYQKAEVVFIGQCMKAEYIFQKDAGLDRLPHIVRYTFDVKHVWKGTFLNGTITIDTGMGFGDCGFQFNLGLSYIVYGYNENGRIYTGICRRTRLAGFYPDYIEEKAQKEIKELDLLIKK